MGLRGAVVLFGMRSRMILALRGLGGLALRLLRVLLLSGALVSHLLLTFSRLRFGLGMLLLSLCRTGCGLFAFPLNLLLCLLPFLLPCLFLGSTLALLLVALL